MCNTSFTLEPLCLGKQTCGVRLKSWLMKQITDCDDSHNLLMVSMRMNVPTSLSTHHSRAVAQTTWHVTLTHCVSLLAAPGFQAGTQESYARRRAPPAVAPCSVEAKQGAYDPTQPT